MRRNGTLLGFIAGGALVAAAALAQTAVKADHAGLVYPEAPKGNVVDDYFGTKVPDPYRGLEDLDSATTRAWAEAENKLTFSYLDAIPERGAIRKRLTELWDYERFGVPFVEGGRTFYTRNGGLQAQSVLYVAGPGGAEPHELLDPNTFSKDGTVALSGTSASSDGRRLAYSVSTAGSDWQEWRVRDVATGRDTGDQLVWVKFTRAAWTHDGNGFYYGRFDEPPKGAERKATNYYQKLCYHKLGTPQSQDPIVYRRDDHKDWQFGPDVTDDGRYLLINVRVGTDRRNMLFYEDLSANNHKVVELLPDFEAQYSFVANDGPVFYIRTDLAAPNGRLVAIDTRKPERSAWREVIPEAREALERVSLVDDTFIATYLKDASSAVRLYAMGGKPLGEVKLPAIGSVNGFAGKRTDKVTYYSFSNFSTPGTIYRFEVAGRTTTVFKEPKLRADLGNFETEQVFYKSKDGTKVPMFISHRKGIKLDGTNPTLLYAYGGFDIPITPSFAVPNLVWMEMGGVYAVANLRGGGEYGEAWHQAGMLANKQNVFDDFIAAAEWLIANRYTSREKLAVYGASNGGLLIGAVLDQRPDLFGAAIPAVGVMDMLRFQKFTIGWAWTSDYGSSEDPKMFPALFKYSPLHNVKPGTCYPPTLVMTADHDDRVFPGHSFKYAATMQADQGCANPVLIRIQSRAGHGAGRPTAMLIEEATDRLGFLVKALKMPASRF